MPFLKQKFPTFHAFGSASLQELYTQERLNRAQQFKANTLETGVLWNEGEFQFHFEPLPALAQVAPSMSAQVADLDADGHLDIALAQNFYGPQRETGHMDGGVGLVLLGKQKGRFEPLSPQRSGIVVPDDARKGRIVELNGDGRPDLVFAAQNGPMRVFENLATSERSLD